MHGSERRFRLRKKKTNYFFLFLMLQASCNPVVVGTILPRRRVARVRKGGRNHPHRLKELWVILADFCPVIYQMDTDWYNRKYSKWRPSFLAKKHKTMSPGILENAMHIMKNKFQVYPWAGGRGKHLTLRFWNQNPLWVTYLILSGAHNKTNQQVSTPRWNT